MCPLLWERKSFWCITSCSLIRSQFITVSDWDLPLKSTLTSSLCSSVGWKKKKQPLRNVYDSYHIVPFSLEMLPCFPTSIYSNVLSSAVLIPPHEFQGLMVSRFPSSHHYRVVFWYFSSHCMSSLLDFWALPILWARLGE